MITLKDIHWWEGEAGESFLDYYGDEHCDLEVLIEYLEGKYPETGWRSEGEEYEGVLQQEVCTFLCFSDEYGQYFLEKAWIECQKDTEGLLYRLQRYVEDM